jgi:putative copper export protein
MFSRRFCSLIFFVIGLILFVAVWSDNFHVTKSAVMPMTYWGIGFIVSGALMSGDKGRDSSDSER